MINSNMVRFCEQCDESMNVTKIWTMKHVQVVNIRYGFFRVAKILIGLCSSSGKEEMLRVSCRSRHFYTGKSGWVNKWINEWLEWTWRKERQGGAKVGIKGKTIKKEKWHLSEGINQWVWQTSVCLTKYTCQDTEYLSLLLLNTKTTLLFMYNNIATNLTLL